MTVGSYAQSNVTLRSHAASTLDPSPDTLSEALRLAALGFRVIPVTGPQSNRSKPGKEPHIAGWQVRASRDKETIRAWWREFPDANVGVLAGGGLTVVDIDGPDGEAWLEEWDLPETVTATTGRGRHLYFWGDCRSFPAGPSVDVRGYKSYVVAPPSVHASGRRYEWVIDPAAMDLAPLPEWVQEHARLKRARRRGGSKLASRRQRHDDTPIYVEGERNDQLFVRACQMRRGGGLEEFELVPALRAANQECCKPPLPDDEVVQIAKSAAKLPIQRAQLEALAALGLRSRCVLTFVALLLRRTSRGEAKASYGTLAALSGQSPSTVGRSLGELRACNVIRWRTNSFQANTYEFCDLSEYTPEGNGSP